jgi:hypothetical protein
MVPLTLYRRDKFIPECGTVSWVQSGVEYTSHTLVIDLNALW